MLNKNSTINILLFLITLYFILPIINQLNINFLYLSRFMTFAVDLCLIILMIPIFFNQKITHLKVSFIFFLLFSSLTFLYNYPISFSTHINGIRDFLVLYAFIFIIEYIGSDSRYNAKFIKKVNSFFLIFLTTNIFLSVIQFLMYGAGDNVGGSFGPGGSGVLSQIFYILLYYYISRKFIEHPTKKVSSSFVVISPFIILPTILNETKISFIFISIIFLMLIFKNRSYIGLVSLPLVAFSSIYLLVEFYLSITHFYNFMLFFDTDFLFEYLINDKDRDNITRFGKLTLLLTVVFQNTFDYFLGLGYGIHKGQNILGASDIGKKLTWLFHGSRVSMFTMLLQGGFLLLSNIIYTLYKLFSKTGILNQRYFLIFIITITSLFYNDSIISYRLFIFTVMFFLISINKHLRIINRKI